MKKIALLTDGWKRFITYAWVHGIVEKIREMNQDVALYHFNCCGNWSRDEQHNEGEYNIFNLPDLSTFDGIVVDFSNIVDKEQFDKAVKLVRSYEVPVISIAHNIEGFYFSSVDNRWPVNEIMDHLYNVHGYRRFIFAGGPEDNFENVIRAEAYKECLVKFGLSEEENPCWYGDYHFECGVGFMNRVMESGMEFPDVFVCANDNIAAGICARAKELGLQVPGDFAVTGFDNLDKAAFFRPQITTVGYDREKIGGKCFEVLYDIWSGKEVPRHNYILPDCIYAESCGCANNGLIDYREHVKNQVLFGVKQQAAEEFLAELEGNLSKCETFNEMIEYIAEYVRTLDCDGFGIVIDKKLRLVDMSTKFPTIGYDRDDLVVSYVEEKGEKLEFSSVEELNRYMEENGSQNAYLFAPLHFKEQAWGYTFIKNARFLYGNPRIYEILSTVIGCAETLYKRKQLEWANQKLLDIYNKDPLTGVYNRIAYSNLIEPEYNKYKAMGARCAILFLDADKFKEINDNLGHEYGDLVLKKIANILSTRCPKDGYVFRFGGDEFILFYPKADAISMEELRKAFLADFKEQEIEVSMGFVLTDPDENKNLDDYLSLADKNMYEEKGIHHKKH